MPVELDWYDDEKTLLYIKVSGDWTWGDFAATDKRIHELGESIPHTFDAIADLTEASAEPPGHIMSNIARGININPANYRWSFWVKAPLRLRTAIEVLNAATVGYPKRIFVDTVDEAFAKLESYRKAGSDKID